MPTNQPRKVIVLAVDRLSPSQIGAYGNTCHGTDAMNRIASRGILFDQAMSPFTNLESSYGHLFNATSINAGDTGAADETWLAAVNRAGVESTFICDRDWLAESQVLAPYELRQRLADPDDPEPPKSHEPAEFVFDTKGGDPDALLGVQQAVDAQVQMLDDFIGVLLDVLDHKIRVQRKRALTVDGLFAAEVYEWAVGSIGKARDTGGGVRIDRIVFVSSRRSSRVVAARQFGIAGLRPSDGGCSKSAGSCVVDARLEVLVEAFVSGIGGASPDRPRASWPSGLSVARGLGHATWLKFS